MPGQLDVVGIGNLFQIHLDLAIVNCVHSMQAIEFVQMQRDDELWELLISLALTDAGMTGAPQLLLATTAVSERPLHGHDKGLQRQR